VIGRPPLIVLFDANVLYPAPLRDLLIRLARTGIVSARWTDQIHDEWIRSLLRNRPDLHPDKLQRTRELMDAAVPGALVEGYERHVEGLWLPDPDDRHVLAAAIEAGADLIVTFNAKDFPRRIVSTFGIDVRRPDVFVLELLLANDPEAVFAAVRAHRSALRNPPFTVEQYLASLGKTGLRRTVDYLRKSEIDL
jgi:predicted nucleic acid-binding protein